MNSQCDGVICTYVTIMQGLKGEAGVKGSMGPFGARGPVGQKVRLKTAYIQIAFKVFFLRIPTNQPFIIE